VVELEHFFVKCGDPRCISFCDIVSKIKQTNKQTYNAAENLIPATAVGVGNEKAQDIAGAT